MNVKYKTKLLKCPCYGVLKVTVAWSVVIGLLCSDWSDGPVSFDWSTLL